VEGNCCHFAVTAYVVPLMRTYVVLGVSCVFPLVLRCLFHSWSGAYQMRCMDCPLKYIGQTGWTFKTRYKEHIQAVRNNNGNFGYSKHILNTGHTYGCITNTMKVLKTERKGKHLNTLERYYMYKMSRDRLQMNDAYVDTHNPIFKIIQEVNNR
jgi:hypothetical protein